MLGTKKLRLILGIITVFIVATLIIYTNCGTTENQISQASTSEIHQKIFIDPAGETIHLNSADEKVTEESVEHFDLSGVFIPSNDTYESCKIWVQEAYLKPANPDADDNFGHAVSISGSRIVVSAIGEASNQSTITNGPTASANNSLSKAGAAYVFSKVGSSWIQEAYLKPANPDADDNFGFNVSISGNRIVVGAPYEDSDQTTITNGPTVNSNNNLTDAGAAYVFALVNGAWVEDAYLKAPNADENDQFGRYVSISSNRVVVGAHNEDSNQTTITNGPTASNNNGLLSSGAAYVFSKYGSSWIEEAYLKAPNADIGDSFGGDVSISGTRIVVGAFNEASNQTTITNGPTASSNNSLPGSGAAYVFARANGLWQQEAYIKPSNAGMQDWFGSEVSISGTRMVISAPNEDSNQTTITNGPTASADDSFVDAGAAYVFVKNGNSWVQEAYLKASNANAQDRFRDVAISGNRIVVGAIGESSNQTTITNGPTASSNNSSSYSGAAYVFARIGGLWTQEAYFKASNANPVDYFGTSVSLSGNRIVVGALNEDSNQTTITNGPTASSDNSLSASGAAYVYLCVSGTLFPPVVLNPTPLPTTGGVHTDGK